MLKCKTVGNCLKYFLVAHMVLDVNYGLRTDLNGLSKAHHKWWPGSVFFVSMISKENVVGRFSQMNGIDVDQRTKKQMFNSNILIKNADAIC